MTTKLPAYKITYEDGTGYVTSMAKGITLEDARAYFVGKSFEMPDGTMKRIKSVETVETWPEHLARLKKEATIEACNEMIRRSAVPAGHISKEAWSQ